MPLSSDSWKHSLLVASMTPETPLCCSLISVEETSRNVIVKRQVLGRLLPIPSRVFTFFTLQSLVFPLHQLPRLKTPFLCYRLPNLYFSLTLQLQTCFDNSLTASLPDCSPASQTHVQSRMPIYLCFGSLLLYNESPQNRMVEIFF